MHNTFLQAMRTGFLDWKDKALVQIASQFERKGARVMWRYIAWCIPKSKHSGRKLQLRLASLKRTYGKKVTNFPRCIFSGSPPPRLFSLPVKEVLVPAGQVKAELKVVTFKRYDLEVLKANQVAFVRGMAVRFTVMLRLTAWGNTEALMALDNVEEATVLVLVTEMTYVIMNMDVLYVIWEISAHLAVVEVLAVAETATTMVDLASLGTGMVTRMVVISVSLGNKKAVAMGLVVTLLVGSWRPTPTPRQRRLWRIFLVM
ncbi:hypothetical protein V7S43_014287 [Phytophthora oleae]|uniref:Uncharacterized protein n=1 Tax=Phytophthora oleae TaxID=2107226 RepID=A0ABD3F3G6_9STRA